MVVICPKCKVRLKVDETKLSPEGSKFKCPKCSAVLVVKKPAAQAAPQKKELDGRRVLVAHSNPQVRDLVSSLLKEGGYETLVSADGIDVMIKALKELPFLAIVEVSLPKIYGFEICKRLKARPETKGMKFILIPSTYDKTKYRREPVSLYDADDYLEEHDIASHLAEKIDALKGIPPEGKRESAQPSPKAPEPQPEEPRGDTVTQPAAPPTGTSASDEKIERARRLARTIINDIYLYNSAKVDDSLMNDNFYAVFAAEVREGKKLYENRIPQEIREIKDFYREAIDNFLAAKKKGTA